MITAASSSSESLKVPFSKTKASVSLDAMRGIAALLVCSGHFRNLYFVEYHELTTHRILFLIPYLMTAAGHQAVLIFFVLSGFLVGGAVVRSLDQQRWTWKQYLTHRFVRLWLVLLPALVLGAIWDSLLLHHPWAGYGGAIMEHFFPPGILAKAFTLPAFFGNAAFVQGILVPTFGTNGALWSLANEFWYYILFPFAIFAIRPHYKPLSRIFFAIGFVLLSFFVGKNIMLLFPVWLAGTLLLVIPRRNFGFPARVAATVAYIVIFLACTGISHEHAVLSDCILTIATTIFLWVLLAARQRSSEGHVEHLARSMAGFSYTLYVVHMPFMYFVAGFLIHNTPWKPTPSYVLIAFVLFVTTIFYAWLISRGTEFHIIAVRNWVESKLQRL